MKNTYSLKMEIEREKGKKPVIKIDGKCPYCMSDSELKGFIKCLEVVCEMSINVADERITNGKIKSKKKQR